MNDITSATVAHFTAIHRQMRIDTRRFVTAIETAVPGDRAGRLRPLARWARGFAQELHLHHTIEDTCYFPSLTERLPELADVVADLERDHAVVDRIMQRWTPAANRLADPTAPFLDARGEMLALAIELRDLLARHLDVEDEQLVPRLAEAFTEDDMQRLDEQAKRSLPKKGLGFALPWNVDAHDPAERAELIAGAPMILRVLYRLNAGRHRRLVASAFGHAVASDGGSGSELADAGPTRHV